MPRWAAEASDDSKTFSQATSSLTVLRAPCLHIGYYAPTSMHQGRPPAWRRRLCLHARMLAKLA
jgi:hypothetical protein